MLSFEVAEHGKTIQVCCDAEGMKTLVSALERIRASGGHIHLCAPSCGGHELNDNTPWSTEAIGEVIFTWIGD